MKSSSELSARFVRLVVVVLAGGSALLSGGCREAVSRTEWPVMGTVAAIQTRPAAAEDPAERARVQAVFRKIQTALNAHVAESEIRRLAALPEQEILARCLPEMRPCYEAAFALARASGGAFNPRWRGAGTLDLGAIAKGFAVDCAARALEAGEGAVLIDLGGNLKAVKRRGEASRQSWRVGVYSPDGGICACVVLRPGEALATSAEYFRGRHIRDGRTGACAAAGVLSVTVLSPSAMMADGLSTTLFAMGPEEGLAFLARVAPEASAFFLMKDGRRLSSGARFLAP